MFDLPGAGVNLILGLIKQHKINNWCKLGISCAVSGFCSFASAWGAGGIAHMSAGMPWIPALAFGFCEGLIVMAAMVFFRFTHDPLAKGIRASVPASVLTEQNRILEHETVVTVESGKGV